MLPALLLALSIAQAPTSQRGVFSKPDIYGDQVVFTSEGDLWLGDLATKRASRLTRDAGIESWAHFSPDGQKIAFLAQYDGSAQVYVMPTRGGEPARLTWEQGVDAVLGWSPDGNRILYRRSNADARDITVLMAVPSGGGLPRKLAVPRGEFASLAADGRLAYVPVSNEWANWFRYEGGAADQIWIADLKGGFRRIGNFRGVDTTPIWVGSDLYGVSERSGPLNLFRFDTQTGVATAITRNTTFPVRYPNTDGKRIIFEAGPFLSIYDPGTKTTQPVEIDLMSDRIHARPQTVALAANIGSVSIGPTAKRVVVEARGQIVTLPADQGAMRLIERQHGSRALAPTWSPDGTTIAFLSDRTGEYELYTAPASGGAPKQITKGLAANATNLKFSPDGKTIAITDRELRVRLVDLAAGSFATIFEGEYGGSYDYSPTNLTFSPNGKLLAFVHAATSFMPGVSVVDLATKKVYPVGPPGYSVTAPAFSPDGRILAVAMDRNFTKMNWTGVTQRISYDRVQNLTLFLLDPKAASPFAVENEEEPAGKPAEEAKAAEPAYDLEGLNGRAINVPIPPARYVGQAVWTGNRILVMDALEPEGTPGGGFRLVSVDLKAKTVQPALDSVSGFEVSADGKSLLVVQDGRFAIAPLGPGPIVPKPISFAGQTLQVEPSAEWRQILRESWRICRDFFYDPGMHGVDWNRVWKEIEPQAAQIGDRSDLTRLLSTMVSELQCGHAYIGGPPIPSGVVPRPIGSLGIDATPAELGVRIDRILRGPSLTYSPPSPLGDPGLGVKEGDYLLAIDGQPIVANQDYRALLVGTVGRTVLATINSKPAMEGARTVAVRPINDRDLRIADYIRGRSEYVRAKTGGKFGYVYVGDMGDLGMSQWTSMIMAELEKDAVIVDFRANGGGNTSSVLLDQLLMRPNFFFKPRVGQSWRRESWALRGHLAALCNEYNFSDGELVIESWKKLRLGPVIGMRTGGGEVGSGGGYRLIDGGSIYVPNYAAFDNDTKKWVIEGYGATPTIEVVQDPAKAMTGVDAQLDRAIEVLRAEVKKNPIPPIVPPVSGPKGKG